MFSFVIRTKNEATYLEKVLQGIQTQETTLCGIEVVVVDSGSTDQTIEIAKKYGCRIVQIKPEDFTWGHALNVGIHEASGKYIGIISGHCIPTNKNFVENAVQILEGYQKLAAIYGRQQPIPMMDPFEEVDLNYQYPDSILRLMSKGSIPEHLGISNACCVLKKEIWRKIPFNKNVQSCEDGIWADMVMEDGESVGYTSKIGVYHSHPFNPEYLYKKNFWREYCPEFNQKNPHNKCYNFLKFMIKKMYLDTAFYRSGFRKLGIQCSLKKTIYFSFVKNLSMYHAANALRKQSCKIIKYENIRVPGIVEQLQRQLTNERFWEYMAVTKED